MPLSPRVDGDGSGRFCWDAAGDTQQISRTLSAAAASTPTVSRDITGMSLSYEGLNRLRHDRSRSNQFTP